MYWNSMHELVSLKNGNWLKFFTPSCANMIWLWWENIVLIEVQMRGEFWCILLLCFLCVCSPLCCPRAWVVIVLVLMVARDLLLTPPPLPSPALKFCATVQTGLQAGPEQAVRTESSSVEALAYGRTGRWKVKRKHRDPFVVKIAYAQRLWCEKEVKRKNRDPFVVKITYAQRLWCEMVRRCSNT